MSETTSEFWQRFSTGVDVAVASRLPDKLLGVREGFLRYFRGRRAGGVDVSVLPRGNDGGVPRRLDDDAILELARTQARAVAASADAAATFAVGCEAGLVVVRSGGERRFLLRTWAVVLGLGEESWGASGSVQLPSRLVAGLTDEDVPLAIPTGATRRHGGMVAALTAGLENRRSATALASFNALATLFYGIFDRPPGR